MKTLPVELKLIHALLMDVKYDICTAKYVLISPIGTSLMYII